MKLSLCFFFVDDSDVLVELVESVAIVARPTVLSAVGLL